MSSDRVYIMSAGANIHNTYHTSIEEIKPTHVYVIVEKGIYPIPESDAKKGICEAISKVKEYANSGKKRDFDLLEIPDVRTESVRNAVLKCQKKHKGGEFWFNVTGGTTLLSVSLFLAALWMEGKVCVTPTNNEFIRFRIPKMHLEDISKKPVYEKVLKVLNDAGGQLSVSEMYARLNSIYEPMAFEEGEKKRGLSRTTKWRVMEKLIEWDLVERKKIKSAEYFFITEDGRYAYELQKMQIRDNEEI